MGVVAPPHAMERGKGHRLMGIFSSLFGGGDGSSPGLFGGGMNFSDPQTMAKLSMLSALGQMAMPSRLPVPTGAVLATAAGALGTGGTQGIKNQLEQQQGLGAGLANAKSLDMLNVVRQSLGLPATTAQDVLSGKYKGTNVTGLFSGSSLPAPTPTTQAPAADIAPIVKPPVSIGANDTSENAAPGALGPNEQVIAKTLGDFGHNPAQISAALGWGHVESGNNKTGDINPGIVNNSGRDGQLGGSFGWQQWLADRRDALNAFATQQGTSPSDPATQAKFFDQEMRTGKGAGALASAAYWKAQTPDQATIAMAHYGRGAGYSATNPQNTVGFDSRLAAANKYYNTLTQPADQGAGGTQLASAAPTTVSDASPASAATAPGAQAPQITQDAWAALGGAGTPPGGALTQPAQQIAQAASPAPSVLAAPVTGTPAANAPVTAATPIVGLAPGQAMRIVAAKSYLGIPMSPVESALLGASVMPAGPARDLALQGIYKQAGISPFIGGERPGVPLMKFNPQTGTYDIIASNPRAPEGGYITPSGGIAMAPGSEDAIKRAAMAHQSGVATYEPQTYYGPGGQEFLGTRAMLPGVASTAPAAAAPMPTTLPSVPGSNLGVGQGLPQPPSAAPQAAPAPLRPEAAAPTFPVQTPTGAKDVSQITVNDLFPNGQGISKPPAPPPGMGYGPPSHATEVRQKEDQDAVSQYRAEAAGNQEIYQNLAHLNDIIQRGAATGKVAPLWNDIANVAQNLGVKLDIPGGDPEDLGAFNKSSTRLVFAALSKIKGQPRNMEITGLGQANPNLTLLPATSSGIIGDILSLGKWQDSRARLAQEFLTTTGGAPLSDFDAKFNQAAPLVSVTDHYRQVMRDAGVKFPGDKQGAGLSVEEQSLQNARAALKANPGARDAIVKRLQDAGYDASKL